MFEKEKIQTVDGIGKIVYRKSKKNRKIRISIKTEYVLVTFPPFFGFKAAEKTVKDNLEWLKSNIKLINEKKSDIEPIDKKALRNKAKEKLPDRLEFLAEKFDFNYNRVFLRDSSTRWGSCSSKKNINLSIKLAILPEHLMEYVILHELNHLKYPGHQKDFWDSLSILCGTNAKALQKELKAYSL